MIPDHYQALGVQPHAERGAIRAAYLRLMREQHPDHRPGDPLAEAAARRANAAWEVLGSDARRAAYDRLRVRREGGTVRHGRNVARRESRATVTTVAYSPEADLYRQAVHDVTLRVGASVFAVGLLILLAFAAL